MSDKKPLAYYIGENPLRIIEWIVWPVLLLAGSFILSPLFESEGGTSPNGALIATVGSMIALKVYGAVIAGIGASGVYGLVRDSHRARKTAAWLIFFVFMYFTLLRIIIDPANIGWTTYLFNAFMSAAIYLRLRWEELTRDGTSN